MQLALYACLLPLTILATYYLIRGYVRFAKSVTSDKNAVAVIVFFMTLVHFLTLAMFVFH